MRTVSLLSEGRHRRGSSPLSFRLRSRQVFRRSGKGVLPRLFSPCRTESPRRELFRGRRRDGIVPGRDGHGGFLRRGERKLLREERKKLQCVFYAPTAPHADERGSVFIARDVRAVLRPIFFGQGGGVERKIETHTLPRDRDAGDRLSPRRIRGVGVAVAHLHAVVREERV